MCPGCCQRENIVLQLRRILGHSRLQYLGITHAHTHTWLPPHYTRITQKSITYATSTVALFDKYNYNNLNDNTP